MSQKSRVSEASTSPWLQVMRLGVGHSEISTVNCFPLPNKSCFKLTPSISHLSVYFPLGTLASSDDGYKTVTIQRQLLHTFYPWGNEGSQMGIEGLKATRLPGTATPPLSPEPTHFGATLTVLLPPHEDFLDVFSHTVHVYNSFSKQV